MIAALRKKALKVLGRHIPVNLLRVAALRWAGYSIGSQVFIGEDLMIIDELKESGRIDIADRAAIAPRVTLVTHSYPNNSRIRSTAPTKIGSIKIGEDAWIGTGVILLPGVAVGERAVVGAGSVVTKDVEPRTVVAGVPARRLTGERSVGYE